MFHSVRKEINGASRSMAAHARHERRKRLVTARPRIEELESRHLLCLPAPVALTPGAPSPPGEEWNFQQLEFTWRRVNNAEFYILRVLFAPDDSAVVYQRDVPNDEQNVIAYMADEFLPPGGLRWNVKAVHASGCTSLLSNHRYFRINIGINCDYLRGTRLSPILPGRPDPDDPEIITQNPPPFLWNFMYGATHYTFYVQSWPQDDIWIPFYQIPNYYSFEIGYLPRFELPVNRLLRWKGRGLMETPQGQCLGAYGPDLFFIISPSFAAGGGAAPRPVSLSSPVEEVQAGSDSAAVSLALAVPLATPNVVGEFEELTLQRKLGSEAALPAAGSHHEAVLAAAVADLIADPLRVVPTHEAVTDPYKGVRWPALWEPLLIGPLVHGRDGVAGIPLL